MTARPTPRVALNARYKPAPDTDRTRLSVSVKARACPGDPSSGQSLAGRSNLHMSFSFDGLPGQAGQARQWRLARALSPLFATIFSGRLPSLSV